MKKMYYLLSFLVAIIFFMGCNKDVVLAQSEVDNSISTYVAEYFSGQEIQQVIKDKDGFSVTYEVLLKNGFELEFNKSFEIIELNGSVQNPVPESTVPADILDYVKREYPGEAMISWKLEKREQEVALAGGLELVFDRNGKFLRIDS